MAYIISHFWFWLLAIFIAGIATALLTRQAEQPGKIAPWLIWCGLAFLVGALMALLNVFLGRAGVWLETALASFAVFMLGAGAGSLTRKGDLSEHKGWALGLVPAALLWFAGNLFATPNVEADLKRSVAAAIEEAKGNPRNFSVDGRDVLLPNNVADRSKLVGTIGGVDGVRLVSATEKTFAETEVGKTVANALEGGKEAVEKTVDAGKKAAATGWADPGKAARQAAGKAAEAGAAAVVAGKAAEAGAKAVTGWADPGKGIRDAANKSADAGKAAVDQTKKPADQAKAPTLAAPGASAAEKAAAAKTALKTLPASGPLDAATCQTALNATLALDQIQFRSGGVGIHRASAYVLDRLAALLRRCPEQKVEIGGYTDNVGDDEDNQALSQRRATRSCNISSTRASSAGV